MKNYILIIIAIYFCLMTAVSCSKKTLKPKTSHEKAINISPYFLA